MFANSIINLKILNKFYILQDIHHLDHTISQFDFLQRCYDKKMWNNVI
jgi:hypothetical protein